MKQHIHRHRHTILVATITFVVGVAMGAYFHKETIIVRENTADTPAAMRSVNLMLDYGDGRVHTWNTVSWHETMSVVDLLEFVAGVEGITVSTDSAGGDNVAVVAVDGIATNEDSRWQYWVNNTYEPRVASKYYLKPGDIVVWKFAKEQAE